MSNCTALALVPEPVVVEFRRCTGHCCDPVELTWGPGHHRRIGLIENRDERSCSWWISENLVYLGWVPPSRGGWPRFGTHEYECKHFDKRNRRCKIYHKKRPSMCTKYPEYNYGMYAVCNHPDCTRRTIVLNDSSHLRWMFPDLLKQDKERWYLFAPRVCEAVVSPEVQADIYAR